MKRSDEFENALISYLGDENLTKIRSTKIGIAGAGGLGSNCAFNLVRTGVRKLKIIDFDIVEYRNLNRQFYFLDQVGMMKVEALRINLERIDPDIELETSTERIESDNIIEIFRDCDIVIEAFDKAPYKSMLVTKLLPIKKLIVSASGLAGVGRNDEIKVHRIKENLILIGDLSTDAESAPPLSPRVNIAAAKQADMVLEYLLGLDVKF
jgi:sulfur carrier protein ThiS adenylyltransferase